MAAGFLNELLDDVYLGRDLGEDGDNHIQQDDAVLQLVTRLESIRFDLTVLPTQVPDSAIHGEQHEQRDVKKGKHIDHPEDPSHLVIHLTHHFLIVHPLDNMDIPYQEETGQD